MRAKNAPFTIAQEERYIHKQHRTQLNLGSNQLRKSVPFCLQKSKDSVTIRQRKI